MPQIKINGVEHTVDADPQMPLLWAIRDIVGLTGTKFGCGVGACGACTVHLDGQAVRSCLTALADAQGHDIVTIEGLSADGTHPVQLAWEASNVPQCGYCQAGQIMQAAALLKQTPKPTISRSSMRCPATSAAAAPISVFGRPSNRRRRLCDDCDYQS